MCLGEGGGEGLVCGFCGCVVSNACCLSQVIEEREQEEVEEEEEEEQEEMVSMAVALLPAPLHLVHRSPSSLTL